VDIARNWRLKSHRNQLLATVVPEGGLVLPQGPYGRGETEVYVYGESGVSSLNNDGMRLEGGNGHRDNAEQLTEVSTEMRLPSGSPERMG